MLRCVYILLFAFLTVAWPQGLSRETVAAIEKLVTAQMSRDSIPAVTVAVATGGEMRWSQGFGLADMENFVPAKATTVYRLGSISKPITAVAAMQLWEAGKLDLDAPVQRYVPSFPEKPEGTITPRLLLAHLGGIRHYNGDEIESTRHYTDLIEPLKIFAVDALIAPPGTKYLYTTYGYNLLGAAVESAAGQRFLDYVKTRILDPAGIDRLRDDNRVVVLPNRARGYTKQNDGQVVNCGLADTSNKIPGGGLAGTAGDVVKFALAVHTGKLLKPSTVEAMFTPQKTLDGKRIRYGLGWALENVNGRSAVGHSGGQQGTSTMLLMLPKEGHAVAAMCNLDGAGMSNLAREILKLLMEQDKK
jgi:serine beta-lactamase-like protein LACTB, mitochondrial